MGFAPVVGNLLPGADPHLVAAGYNQGNAAARGNGLDAQAVGSAFPRTSSSVRFPLGVQHVKAVFQIGIKLLRGVESGRWRSACRWRRGQARCGRWLPSLQATCSRKVNHRRNRVVIKAAVLHHQLAGVRLSRPVYQPVGGLPNRSVSTCTAFADARASAISMC